VETPNPTQPSGGQDTTLGHYNPRRRGEAGLTGSDSTLIAGETARLPARICCRRSGKLALCAAMSDRDTSPARHLRSPARGEIVSGRTRPRSESSENPSPIAAGGQRRRRREGRAGAAPLGIRTGEARTSDAQAGGEGRGGGGDSGERRR
jgi:hypothetical protein